MKITLTLTGTAPLLMHSDRMVNPLDPIVRAMKPISAKRKKTDADYEALAELEFRGSIYHDDITGPFIPGENIEKAIVEGGRITKQGKQVERGMFVIDDRVPLIYPGPRTVDELWADPGFRHMKSVRVGQSRVMRTRPMFNQWLIETVAEVDDGLLNLDSLRAIGADAGSMVGLGDYRPRFGRFEFTAEPS